LAVVVALVAFAGTVPEDATAGHGRACGIVTKGGKDFKAYGQNIRCKKARRGARLYLRERRALDGFSCSRDVRGSIVFTCAKGGKSYSADRL
jgi:hypothetical protein